MTLTDRVEQYLTQHANRWVDGRDIARVGGYAGWRTRVSDLRKRGLTIENHWENVQGDYGMYRVSYYRLTVTK